MKLRLFVSVFALLVFASLVLAAENCTKEGGKDYFKAGQALVGADTYGDECVTDQRLLEYYCNDKSELEYEYYDCPEACSAGACSGLAPTPEVCAENWTCTDWSECLDNSQNRTCVDLNECSTTGEKPSEVQSCGTQPPVPPKTTTPRNYTYYIVGGVIVLLIVLYFAFKKKEPEVKPAAVEEKKEEPPK